MIDLSRYNFTKAESAYVVANTPLFIVRNLRSDPAVIRIAGEFSPDEIAKEIERRLSIPPATSRDRIIPFVLLVALAVRQERASIARITKLNSQNYRWFQPVAESLLATTKSISRGTIQMTQPSAPAHPISIAPTKRQSLDLTPCA